MKTKICSHGECQLAGRHQPLESFSLQARSRDGRSSNCKGCVARERDKPENIRRMLWLMARLRAKKRGVPFSIKVDEIVIPERCPALGIKLSRGRRSPMGHSPSLDRIVPSLGYVTGNIIVVSMKANLIKQDANPAELMRVAKFYAKLK